MQNLLSDQKNKIEYDRKMESMSLEKIKGGVQMQNVYSTRYSQAVSHPMY